MTPLFATAPHLGDLFSKFRLSGRTRAPVSPWIALRGIVAIALGIIAFLLPLHALFAFTMLFGTFALVDGLASFLAGIRHRTHCWSMILAGFVGVTTAILFVLTPLLMTVTYALIAPVLLVGWAVATGTLEIVAAMQQPPSSSRDWLLGLSGALSVLLGLFVVGVLLRNPVATILTTAWLIGIYALAAGVVLVVLSFHFHEDNPDAEFLAPATDPGRDRVDFRSPSHRV